MSSSRSNGRPGHTRSSSLPPEGVLCALCEAKERDCTHKMRLGEEKEWLFISQGCRNRVCVCGCVCVCLHIGKALKCNLLIVYIRIYMCGKCFLYVFYNSTVCVCVCVCVSCSGCCSV